MNIFTTSWRYKIKKKWFIHAILLLCLTLPISHSFAQNSKKAMKLGKSALKTKHYDSAINCFTEAIKFQPDYLDAYIYRAKAFERANQLKEAADDYSKASNLKPRDKMLSYEAGRLFHIIGNQIEAIPMLNHSIEKDYNFLPAYFLKVSCLISLKNYPEALLIADQVLKISTSAQGYYHHGLVSELLTNYRVAESDYRISLNLDKRLKESYVGLAKVLAAQNKTDEALDYCDRVIKKNRNYLEAYLTRSAVYYRKSDLLNAVSDMSKAIALNSVVDSFYFIRGIYYGELKQYDKSIEDFTKTLSLNKHNYMAHYHRAFIYEELKQIPEAAADYALFLKLTESNTDALELIKTAKQRVYNLNKETTKPEIIVTSPKVKGLDTIEVALNAKTIVIEGIIKDQNFIDYIKINDKDFVILEKMTEIPFTQEIQLSEADKITITTADIYRNTATVTFRLSRTEIDPPVIDVLTPYASDYDEIFLESESPTIYIEGKLSDESFIEMITIEGIGAKFFKDKKNPNFSATINIAGKDKIEIKAVDIFGNSIKKEFKLNRETARIMAGNPMGKTWVIFIDNSDYESFASLEGPSKDITTMRAALSKYDIHNIIEKKNMNKLQMEKFFSLELRDLVKNQKVNSLLVWYAGHGKFVNETGYWIPVDAKRDEEFTYFNVNSLKAFLQSYTNYVTHVLVISDACESGPSFYAAMRTAQNRNCGDSLSNKFRSSQVFSSAGYELAADNSPFTKTFAKSLDFNTKNCIAIDNIVKFVTESIGKGTKQSPKFGKIQGLEDEDGTFFFMKKVP